MGKKSLGGRRGKGKARLIIINLIRLLLLLAFLMALYTGRDLVSIIATLAFFVTFLPWLLRQLFGVELPAIFEIIVILFIYGLLFLGEVKGLFAGVWWWGALLNLVASTILGFVGLAALYSLYSDKKINASPLVIAIFAFAFALAMGSVWEIFEYSMDSLLGFDMQRGSLGDTMGDMIMNFFGALFVAVMGYFCIKSGKINVISSLVTSFIERNPRIFGREETLEKSSDEIFRLIRKGEGRKLEFKSTLRTNLHTNNADKKIEHSVLKTIAAYLNSDGGTLLIGISDSGNITGTEKDNFQDNDALNLHFTNMLKHHIGNEYLPFIQFELYPIEDRHVLRIDCRRSDKPVFLKFEGEEEFYVRNGPSSVKVSGSSLVDYISHNFNRA